MSADPAKIIEAKNLKKKFGEFSAVDEISFHMIKGECLGLLGPNGAGKTSTVRMLYGFSPMTQGSLTIFGLDMRNQWRAIKKRIGVCQQDNSLDPDLSVIQNLELFARYFDIPKKAARERARQLLEFIALDQRKDDTVTQLSGGMMRRLVLARALINDPELLILDEPTTGLDPQSRYQLWERLLKLKSEGLSILLTTHNMDEAFRVSDRLIIMDHGKILVDGKPSELVSRYAGREVIEVADPGEDLRSFVKTNSLMHDDLSNRLIIYDRGNEQLFKSIGSRFCAENCTFRMATLEDVFLRLTGRDLRD